MGRRDTEAPLQLRTRIARLALDVNLPDRGDLIRDLIAQLPVFEQRRLLGWLVAEVSASAVARVGK